jgi:hypothetical protein
MRTAAVLERTQLSVRRLNYLTVELWPHHATGSGQPRNYTERETAVLAFVAVASRSPLWPDGLPVAMGRAIDRLVTDGTERMVVLDGDGWSVVLER